MKKSELFFGAVVLPIDYVALLLAGALAYYLRLSPLIQRWRPVVFQVDLPFAEFMQLTAVVSAAIVGIFAIQGLYTMQSTRRALDETAGIFSGITLGVMLVIVAIFLRAEGFQSRFILLAAYAFGITFVLFGRFGVRRLQRWLLSHGYGVHRVLLAGNGHLAEKLAAVFAARPQLGYRVVANIPIVRWDMLERVYRERGIDEVIQTDPTLPEEDNLLLLDFCEQYKIDYKYIPNLFETHAAHMQFRQLGSVPLMELQRTPLDGWGRIAKRSMDIAGALGGLIVLSPFLLLTAFLIRLDSRGSIFYKQTRVGRNMRPFEMFKFRSMYSQFCTGEKYGGVTADSFDDKLREGGNERRGPLFKMKNDPRITRVGKFLRRWRVDELPQLFNVLLGHMSLLGPRPHLPKEVARYDKFQRKLFTIKPGMSGMAQVAGSSGLPFDEEAKLDIAYIEQWSLRLDLILLLKTFKILFTDPNAV